jgi:hypothetical protein
MFLSTKTIANNVSNILAKLQVAERSAAIVAARDAGLGHRTGHPDDGAARSLRSRRQGAWTSRRR